MVCDFELRVQSDYIIAWPILAKLRVKAKALQSGISRDTSDLARRFLGRSRFGRKVSGGLTTMLQRTP